MIARFLSRRRPPEPTPLPDHIESIRLAALKGDPLAQTQWGQALLSSTFMQGDPTAAAGWFTIAASAGFGPAHNMLGRCYHFGRGVEKNMPKAAEHYEKAAELGDEWGRYNLGILLLRGLGVEADRPRAFILFRDAAQNGHAKSMNLYARFLEEGWEVPQDQQAALSWYRRSAESGDYRGQHNYATALAEAGLVEEALHWWRQAIEDKDMTPDILQAMRRSLTTLGTEGDTALLATVAQRLTTILRKHEDAGPH
ncbi:tetratricopeptide repeat protein [Acetobacter conturbans]|uniref:Sel1 repeat family protein n=1 Tax=Acetobacter conturbans TaxID=1737472 RepID=A0ABX0K498_9PROT|nr:tetratricopeptide repeat protein [Acetobacter conturbans]NHN88822.1 sel1 repeat family protein [Acetobacter conturbans]